MSLFAFLAPVVASSEPAGPLAGLHDLVGTWKCTYRAAAVRLPYGAVFAYERGGRALRQTVSLGGEQQEEVTEYDPPHHAWTQVVLDGHGSATVMHASGSDPKHIAYRSVYPDASIAETFDLTSPSQYLLHATYVAHGKTITSVDTCLRNAP